MISEELRPSPLPGRRMTPLHWAGITVAIGLLAAGFYYLGVITVTMVVVGFAVALATVRRFETSFAVLFVLSMGVSYDLLLSLRPELSSTPLPINALDFATGLVVISLLLNALDQSEKWAIPSHIRWPYRAFTLVTIFAFGYGIVLNSGSLYTYFKDARLFAVLYIVLFGVSRFIRSQRQLRLLAYMFVTAGLICALQQILKLITGGTASLQNVRDVTLPTPVLPMSIIFLMLYRHRGIRLGPPNSYPFLISILSFALLVSFTRSAWVAMAMSYVIGIRYMGAKQRARALLIAGIGFVLLVFVTPFFLDLYSHGMDLQKLVEVRIQSLANTRDLSTQDRLASYADAWIDYLRSPVWGEGIGHPIIAYQPELGQVIESELLHNSYLYYGIKLGGVGLFALIWLLVASAWRSVRAARAPPASESAHLEVQVFAQALVASVVPFLIIGPWSGNLNYVAFMPLLGLITGLNWERIAETATLESGT